MPLIKRRYLFPFIWFGMIVYASLTPSEKIPNLMLFPHFDKLVHFCIYLGLSFLLVPALLKEKKYLNAYYTAVLLSTFTGLIFELLQTYATSSRSGSLADELANTAGAITGVILYHLLVRNKKTERFIFRIE
jgi:VanZ family protein